MKRDPQPSSNQPGTPNRREFLARSSAWVAGSALAGLALPQVHSATESTLRLALVGCGGRGTGAAANALEVPGQAVKLVAMADLFEDRLSSSYGNLKEKYKDQVDVPEGRRFVGFDAYRQAIDCLRPGDVVALCTHAAFRGLHLDYAVQKGVNVFMEKSFAPDPGSVHRILKLADEADRKNLKIGVGLMCRHSSARQALIDRIRSGDLGEITFLQACRMDSGDRMGPVKSGDNELYWQIRHPYFFFWVSTGRFIDYLIHQVDECCWVKDSWPVSAQGLGGRAPDSIDCGQNLDTYGIEYTFADGAKAFVNGRFIPKCYDDFATFVHGTKCAAQFSGNIHAPTVQMYRDQRIANNNIVWRPAKETLSPYQAEWNLLVDAIQKNQPYNEAKRGALANLTAIMGRAAVHMGRVLTWEEMMASTFQFCPDVSALKADSPAPVRPDAQGHYPVPVPGVWNEI
jgi:predicted dehydrogenase